MARVTVALVDDHPVVHEGMRSWLDQDPEHRVELVAAARTVDEVLAGPGRDAQVLLLDLNLDGRMAIEEVTRLAEAGRRVAVARGLGVSPGPASLRCVVHDLAVMSVALFAPARTMLSGMKPLEPMPKSAAPPARSCGTFTPGPPSTIFTSSPCFL